MSRYIKLADALQTLADTCYLDEIDKNMQELPSIDIVRCGECKCGLRTNFIKEPYLMCEQWSDDGNARTVRPNDFCSYGDRVTNTTVEDKPTPIRDYMVHGEMKGADDE